MTAVDRNHHRVDAPAPRDVERFTQRFSVQGVEAAVPRRVDARTFDRRKNSADGDHARSC